MSDATDYAKAVFRVWWDVFKRTRGWGNDVEAEVAAWAAWQASKGPPQEVPDEEPL